MRRWTTLLTVSLPTIPPASLSSGFIPTQQLKSSLSIWMSTFESLKELTLHNLAAGVDNSFKGSVDKPIAELVSFLNSLSNCYTTSSCSGRISVFESGLSSKQITWLLVKHRKIETTELVDAVRGYRSSAIEATSSSNCCFSDDSEGATDSRLVLFKCESFILHIHCRSIDSARELHNIATNCGFRESGIKIGEGILLTAELTSSPHELYCT